MIELPEAVHLARQLTRTARGKEVRAVAAAHTDHAFAWYHGDPGGYDALLRGRTVEGAASHGGFVELDLGGARLLFAEGVGLRWHGPGEAAPPKHQLHVRFDDGSVLSATVRLYGGLWAFEVGGFDNPYYARAVTAPSPLTDAFDHGHFASLRSAPAAQKLSLKGLLATEQRIPGLGNGVLQDVLFAARLHPRRRVASLTEGEAAALFAAVKGTLADMAGRGGRDTEGDLFGRPGGYATVLSRRTLRTPCPRCGATIVKESFLGGAVYACPGCQPVRPAAA